ncbi:hypothetical protein RI054_25g105610 [Pseudoscourfieldia marina]
MLTRYDRMRRRVCSRATYFFNLGEKARGDAFARWLPVALKAVGAAAPPNGHYAPKSFRSGFASAVTAMNVSPDRRNYIAGRSLTRMRSALTTSTTVSSLTTPPASFLATSSACRRLLWRCLSRCRALELAAGQFGVTIGDTRLSSSWRYAHVFVFVFVFV